jgi:hypothetical protein
MFDSNSRPPTKTGPPAGLRLSQRQLRGGAEGGGWHGPAASPEVVSCLRR